MICGNCQSSNSEDANFCLRCGYRISVVCPRCSRRVASHAAFCDGCGMRLVPVGDVHQTATGFSQQPVTGDDALPARPAYETPLSQPAQAPSDPAQEPMPTGGIIAKQTSEKSSQVTAAGDSPETDSRSLLSVSPVHPYRTHEEAGKCPVQRRYGWRKTRGYDALL